MDVVIVEDELIVAMDLEMKIQSYGHDVLGIASSFEVATGMIEKNKPELIFMDVNIKGDKSGIDTVEYLRKVNINTPVVFLTAFSNSTLYDKILSMENTYYMRKPYNDRMLSQLLEQNYCN